MDLYLEAADGTVLLKFNWDSSVHWDLSFSTTWSYEGMTFTACVDGCVDRMTAGPYFDGREYDLSGVVSFSDECM